MILGSSEDDDWVLASATLNQLLVASNYEMITQVKEVILRQMYMRNEPEYQQPIIIIFKTGTLASYTAVESLDRLE